MRRAKAKAMPQTGASSGGGSSEKALRVLHIVDREHFRRFGRMFRELGLALDDVGVRVSLATDDAEAAAEFEGTPVTAHLIPGLSGWRRWRIGGALEAARTGEPANVHLWGARSLAGVSRWAASQGASLVVHLTSEHDVQLLLRRTPAEHEQPVVCCQRHAEDLAQRWPTLTQSTPVCPPALLCAPELPESSVRDHVLGVLWTGVLDAASGVDLLIDALAEMSRQGFEAQLVLIGGGPAAHDVWRRVRRRGVQDCVSMTDGGRLWEHSIAGADVFVLPARHTVFSLPPLLAMSLGKVVIAEETQIADWLIAGETFVPFAPGAADELAARLIDAAQAKPAVRAIARSAAEYVRAHHGVSRMAASLHDVYRVRVSERRGASTGSER
ncbi:MAG: glycosyltransferase [Planctomycetota bacterium]|nr:MAG: glycosyltransferase [Planctomycetota bacterium]